MIFKSLEDGGASPTIVGTSECGMAVVDPDTGVPTCIEAETVRYLPPDQEPGVGEPIQFDATGAVYYRTSNVLVAPGGKLKRYDGGTSTELYSSCAASPSGQFLVMPNGVVYFSSTQSFSSSCPQPYEGEFLRRINLDGTVDQLKNAPVTFLDRFPDGNVYAGLIWTGEGNLGVRRIFDSSGTLDAKYWIHPNSVDPSDTEFSISSLCGPQGEPLYDEHEEFCNTTGARVSFSFQEDGEQFLVAGYMPNGTLVKYFPTVEFVDVDVVKIRAAADVGDDLVLSGLNAAGENILIRYDPATGDETLLLGPDNEIEVSHIGYSASTDQAIFKGRRISDGKNVIGRVDIPDNEVTINDTGSETWEGFVALS
jgi:hypothetical protein